MSEPVDLDVLDALHEKATPGEWDQCEKPNDWLVLAGLHSVCETLRPSHAARDTALIVALHNAYPALAAELRQLREVCAESNAVCVCGCPDAEHEHVDEGGECCGVDGHECVRTSVTVLAMLEQMRDDLSVEPDLVEWHATERAIAMDRAKQAEAVVVEIKALLDNEADVKDGGDGPLPNDAMRYLEAIEEIEAKHKRGERG
jgi:hypothetical protein